jgi:hypothetical protein
MFLLADEVRSQVSHEVLICDFITRFFFSNYETYVQEDHLRVSHQSSGRDTNFLHISFHSSSDLQHNREAQTKPTQYTECQK